MNKPHTDLYTAKVTVYDAKTKRALHTFAVASDSSPSTVQAMMKSSMLQEFIYGKSLQQAGISTPEHKQISADWDWSADISDLEYLTMMPIGGLDWYKYI